MLRVWASIAAFCLLLGTSACLEPGTSVMLGDEARARAKVVTLLRALAPSANIEDICLERVDSLEFGTVWEAEPASSEWTMTLRSTDGSIIAFESLVHRRSRLQWAGHGPAESDWRKGEHMLALAGVDSRALARDRISNTGGLTHMHWTIRVNGLAGCIDSASLGMDPRSGDLVSLHSPQGFRLSRARAIMSRQKAIECVDNLIQSDHARNQLSKAARQFDCTRCHLSLIVRAPSGPVLGDPYGEHMRERLLAREVWSCESNGIEIDVDAENGKPFYVALGKLRPRPQVVY